MLKSSVKITCRPYDSNSKTKAFIELVLDNTLVIKGMTLVEGSKGLFLSFPSSKGKDGKYYNSIYSMDKEFTGQLEEACIKKYNEVRKDSDNSNKQQFS
jgi:DNA-binding cell septation regulator SpoVG